MQTAPERPRQETRYPIVRRPGLLILFLLVAFLIAAAPALVNYFSARNSALSYVTQQNYATTTVQNYVTGAQQNQQPFDFTLSARRASNGQPFGQADSFNLCSPTIRSMTDEELIISVVPISGTPRQVSLVVQDVASLPQSLIWSVNLSPQMATPPFDATLTITPNVFHSYPYGESVYITIVGDDLVGQLHTLALHVGCYNSEI